MKSRLLRSLRNIAISIVVLAVLIGAGGVVYTWYMGQNPSDNTAAIAAPVEAETAPVVKRTQPAANAPESAAVQMLTSPVAPGSNASITVKTNMTSQCTISVVYDKTVSKDSGLGPKTADEYGMVSWTWTVEPSVPLGKWPVKVTCVYNKRSAVVQGMLEVSKQAN